MNASSAFLLDQVCSFHAFSLLMSAPHHYCQYPQLMELADLACAQALEEYYPVKNYRRVLVCCRPRNSGGDRLGAARYLGIFGFEPTIYFPKVSMYERHDLRRGWRCEFYFILILFLSASMTYEPNSSYLLLSIDVAQLKPTLQQSPRSLMHKYEKSQSSLPLLWK